MRIDSGAAARTDRLGEFCRQLDRTDIRIVFCKRFDGKSGNWNLTRHMHDVVELIYFLNGDVEISTTEAHSSAGDYDVIVYPRGMYHSEKLQGRGSHDIFCVWADLGPLQVPGMIWVQDDRGLPVKWLLEHMHAEYTSDQPEPALIQHYAKAAIILIARKALGGNVPDGQISSRPFERAVRFMHDHLAEPLTVDGLAKAVSVSSSYLSRIFRQKVGVPPGIYLRSIRIETARAMLSYGTRTIEEIAGLIGFSSPKYFSHAFRKETGMTPSEWRRRSLRSEVTDRE